MKRTTKYVKLQLSGDADAVQAALVFDLSELHLDR
jgi:hypothetical protein